MTGSFHHSLSKNQKKLKDATVDCREPLDSLDSDQKIDNADHTNDTSSLQCCSEVYGFHKIIPLDHDVSKTTSRQSNHYG